MQLDFFQSDSWSMFSTCLSNLKVSPSYLGLLILFYITLPPVKKITFVEHELDDKPFNRNEVINNRKVSQ